VDRFKAPTWIITGVVIPLVVAIIAAIPVWLQVIRPRLDGNGDPTPTSPAPTRELPAPDIPDADALNSALLAPEDFPESGWELVDVVVVEEPCALNATRAGFTGVTEAIRYQGELFPYVYHEVSAFVDNAEATYLLDGIIATMESCASSMRHAPGGELVPSTIEELVVPQLGDQSFAFREVIPGSAGQYVTDTVYVRRANLLSILIVTTTAEPSPAFSALVEGLATIAQGKLAAIAY